MFKPRLTALLVPLAALVALAAAPAERKDPVGVYALIDSVTFFPTEANAERVQLWGVFSLPDNIGLKDGKIDYIQIGGFHAPRRGYLYYTLNPENEARSRAEWAELKQFAGTRNPVAFGRHFPPGKAPSFAMGIGGTIPDLTEAELSQIVNWFNHHNGRLRPAGEPLAAPDTFRLRSGFSITPDRSRPVVASLFLPDIPPAGH